MPDRPIVVKTLVALMMASIAGIIMSGGGVVAFGIGLFLIVNAFLVLGALVWA